MNKQQIDTISQIIILSLGGSKDYDLMYQHSFDPMLAHIGLSASHYCKYLIRMFEACKPEDKT